jgi:hypothetical protein
MTRKLNAQFNIGDFLLFAAGKILVLPLERNGERAPKFW